MEKKIKHLELIQNIINRMNSNSFIVKGWSITLITTVLALYISSKNTSFIIITTLIFFSFWIMDGFYISRERMFRDLYATVANKKEDEIDFKMQIHQFNTGNRTWISGIFSKTLLPFYCVLLFGIIMFLVLS
ncbi:hypothetical protein [Aquimarina algicola]|uniref:Uncharacterized protein n=1 Tax=Aquimarina algicola TaxID=2589995 RepID=A0A504J3R3_9FLAO|nr:hypothetical protein [Aquimarina algicola]TPN81729.1 hypothetical protein FHK87_24325 [Aquimarina algicola]